MWDWCYIQQWNFPNKFSTSSNDSIFMYVFLAPSWGEEFVLLSGLIIFMEFVSPGTERIKFARENPKRNKQAVFVCSSCGGAADIGVSHLALFRAAERKRSFRPFPTRKATACLCDARRRSHVSARCLHLIHTSHARPPCQWLHHAKKYKKELSSRGYIMFFICWHMESASKKE